MRIRYFTKRAGAQGLRYYWQPSTALCAQGWELKRLPDDLAAAQMRARELNSALDAWRAERKNKRAARADLGPKHPAPQRAPAHVDPAHVDPFAHLDLPAPIIGKVGACQGVYLLVRCDGLVKIGIAVKPETRLRQLEQAQPNRLKLLRFYPAKTARALERSLHSALSGKRVKGEWFNITPRTACEIVDRIAGTVSALEGNVPGTPLVAADETPTNGT